MSDITGQTGLRGGASAVVNESYSFACMRCGHGWEQAYEIEHHTGADGHEFVLYVADGRIVPSPLSRPACQNCDGHVVRIMRAGQVSSVLSASRPRKAPPAGPVQAPVTAAGEEPDASAATPAGAHSGEPHHWHLSDLLHPFRKAS
ncbi:hypothetical protein ACWC9X_28555 [Streptomyces asoensis]|uniref:hypothetical protein n=1 Tax=Streptomyces TaxID=1883 RepID=UPI00190CC176|nr:MULTISPECIES: hypothetical protein [unclassified Streptomyces]MBK3624069.1 hypothetical protein [Streptomyces sp. MBT49]MBK3633896.1 hypothetical protein [Streptomyces sp. MBT97]